MVLFTSTLRPLMYRRTGNRVAGGLLQFQMLEKMVAVGDNPSSITQFLEAGCIFTKIHASKELDALFSMVYHLIKVLEEQNIYLVLTVGNLFLKIHFYRFLLFYAHFTVVFMHPSLDYKAMYFSIAKTIERP